MILILDFGSQYTQLIARRVRELGVYCEIHSCRISQDVFFGMQSPCAGIILSGGPSSVADHQNLQIPSWVFEVSVPVLGICYGMQAMAVQQGGVVEASDTREFGHADVRLHGHSPLFEHIEDSISENGDALLHVWMSHGDKVVSLPPEFQVICSSSASSIAGMQHKVKPWYGLQFHPEVTHTRQGMRILERFVLNICGAQRNWTFDRIIEHTLQDVRDTVGAEHVILGLSGGVDSSVVAALLHRAIADQLTCIFVDTGLLRLGERAQVLAMFHDFQDLNIRVIDAEQQFLEALDGVVCPESKRKIIGKLFIDIFESVARTMPKVRWLAQGTIYPDVIESAAAGEHGVVIKSHHNVGGLPERLDLQLLEPLRTLFKDEVRQLGLELGLPHAMIYRHPFPGPGLAVRVLGAVKKEYLDILRRADAIFIEALHAADLYDSVSQAFAVFLPVKTVGVMGDGRTYEYVISLRAVETIDFMTAHWARLPWEFLAGVSHRIINEVAGVARVTYDISGKPPATIEWE